MRLDLTDKTIAALCVKLLREIAERARASDPGGLVSARLCGRVLALRLGVPTFEAQRVAKTLGRRWR